MAVLLAGMATAYSQTKIQFIEGQSGQSILFQGCGYSLFDNAVGDNQAFTESIHVGWGIDSTLNIGAYIEATSIMMPNYDEAVAAFSLGFDLREYIQITPLLRCHYGTLLGGVYAANSYTLADINKHERRWGFQLALFIGAEIAFNEHLYIGANLSFSAAAMLTSTFEPTDATPQEGDNSIVGNKLLISAGYRF